MLFQSKAEDAPMTHPDRDARMLNELLRTVVALRNVGEARRFFRDLLTDDELDMISRRWRVVHLLAEGVPYREIERAYGHELAHRGPHRPLVQGRARWLPPGLDAGTARPRIRSTVEALCGDGVVRGWGGWRGRLCVDGMGEWCGIDRISSARAEARGSLGGTFSGCD
jgi:uncharacterized protein YerC